jgi:hypothetical protein
LSSLAPPPADPSRDSFSPEDADLQRRKLDGFDTWYSLTRQLLDRLVHTLDETIQAWEDFDLQACSYFLKPDGPTNVSEEAVRSLGVVENLFLDLRKIRNHLDHLRSMFHADCKASLEKHARDVSQPSVGPAVRTWDRLTAAVRVSPGRPKPPVIHGPGAHGGGLARAHLREFRTFFARERDSHPNGAFATRG